MLGDRAFMATRPELRSNVADVVAALQRAKAAGKARHISVCNFGTEDLAVRAVRFGMRLTPFYLTPFLVTRTYRAF